MEMVFITGSARTLTKKMNEIIKAHPHHNFQFGPQTVTKTLFGLRITISCMITPVVEPPHMEEGVN